MSYYTVVPNVRDQHDSGYITNFCAGDWKVLNEGNWLQLNPLNTRVRDKNNATWIETCDGHKIEVPMKNSKLDCACYSKNFNETLNRDLNIFASASAEATPVDFILYGTMIGACDYSPFVYIPYYTQADGVWTIRMYCINKATASIANITVDSVPKPSQANVYVENNDVVIKTPTITYRISFSFIINANFEQSRLYDYMAYFNGQQVIVDGGVASILGNKFNVTQNAQYCILDNNYMPNLAVFHNNALSIFDADGALLGSSVSDANSVYFFTRENKLISIEGHDNYIRIKGVE